MQSRELVRKMSPPERTYRHADTSRAPTFATMDQFLGGGESSKMSPIYSPNYSKSPSSPYFERMKHHDPEEDQGLYQKKSSVLVKMREGVKRLRNSFRMRKQEEEGNLTPSWGVSLEDYEEEEEDAEYLGAPMYESELALEGYKENARQHPRANPVISEKHVLHSPVKSRVEQDQEKQASLVNSTTTQPATTTTAHSGPHMKMSEKNLAEKLAPAYAAGSYSDTANSISSKIQGLAVSRTTSAKMSSQTYSIASPTTSISSAPLSTQTSLSSSHSMNGRNTISPKGASVKEYLKIKFEPGNDEKVLSEVISEAMSPRRTTTTNDAGVIDKVRGAVSSLLHNEEPSQQYANKVPTTRASSQTPAIVSTNNLQEVGYEENHGRILQAN